MRHIVTIEEPVEGRNAYGEAVTDWQEIAIVSARVQPLRGQEFLEAQRLETTISHRVRMRYRRGITSRMRLRMGKRILNIVGPPIDLDERHREIHLMCAEAA